MPFYEASAKENVSIEDAFKEIAKMTFKRESENQISHNLIQLKVLLEQLICFLKNDFRKNKT